jgi:hypothetical protein
VANQTAIPRMAAYASSKWAAYDSMDEFTGH